MVLEDRKICCLQARPISFPSGEILRDEAVTGLKSLRFATCHGGRS